MSRVYNFSAGPAVLPEEVLQEAADEMLDYKGSGMSVMEMSHRSKVYDNIIKEAEQDLRDLMNIPDNYKVLFLQGGASQQFAMIPMNLMKNRVADYIITGQWAKKAAAEKRRLNFISPYDVTHTGKILLKMRPELAVDYFAECLNDSDLKQFKTIIQESLDDAKDKEKRGYIYKPRRKIIEPDQFDIEIQNLVREQYINL